METQYVIGIDYGTDSVRAVLVNALNGKEIASTVFAYPRWKAGLFCDAAGNQFRQHPLDYIEGLEYVVKTVVAQVDPAAIRAISIDTTGSTPVAVDRTGTPLGLVSGFEENANALFVLWKDHTATKEAEEINAVGGDYLKHCGGIYSSEWYWAKLLHILRADKMVRSACYAFVEHCDWIPFLLTGGTDVSAMKRSRCAAGHKALWNDGLPPDEFFSSIDPLLSGLSFGQTYTADQPAGTLCAEWAERLGLSTEVVVGVGAFDAHMGAVGGQIEPYFLSKVMGTSTCDMMVVPEAPLVKGICGQVDGSVIPGMVGLEAGQSAFGDTYAWFRDLLLWPFETISNSVLKEHLSDRLIGLLSEQAALFPLDMDAELAVDWLNGRRTPDADQRLKAGLVGLRLGTDAPRIFRALAEGTCFGAKAIVERFIEQAVPVKGIIGIGGVAKKSPYIMQLLADVLQMEIRIHRSEQTCAIGAAMFAATACGIYKRVEEAMQAMGSGFERTYYPDKELAEFYDRRYTKYKALGEFICTTN